MIAKQQTYEQEMQPLVQQLIDLGEKHGINIAVVAHMEEDSSDMAVVLGACYFDGEQNGVSPHVLAVDQIGKLPPEFAMAVFESAKRLQRDMEAAANPHGVAE